MVKFLHPWIHLWQVGRTHGTGIAAIRLVVGAILLSGLNFSHFYAQVNGTRITSGTSPSEMSALARDFLSAVGIRLGEYKVYSGDLRVCSDTDLWLLDFGREVTLMSGAHALIAGIGATESDELDRNCRTRVIARWGQRLATGSVIQDCSPDRHYERSIVIRTDAIGLQIIERRVSRTDERSTSKLWVCNFEHSKY